MIKGIDSPSQVKYLSNSLTKGLVSVSQDLE